MPFGAARIVANPQDVSQRVNLLVCSPNDIAANMRNVNGEGNLPEGTLKKRDSGSLEDMREKRVIVDGLIAHEGVRMK